MKINVFNNYGVLPFAYRKIVKTVEAELTKHFKLKTEISLIFVSNEEIKNLNKQYRMLDQKTDVLSFPSETEAYLGEVFIAVDVLIQQAKQLGHSFQRETAFLMTHGILHLLGYNHLNKNEENEMFNLTEEILKNSGYGR